MRSRDMPAKELFGKLLRPVANRPAALHMSPAARSLSLTAALIGKLVRPATSSRSAAPHKRSSAARPLSLTAAVPSVDAGVGLKQSPPNPAGRDYEYGQRFQHRTRGYRGVVLFPWRPKVSCRLDNRPALYQVQIYPDPVQSWYHSNYQVVLDGNESHRGDSFHVIFRERQTIRMAEEETVLHEDIIPYVDDCPTADPIPSWDKNPYVWYWEDKDLMDTQNKTKKMHVMYNGAQLIVPKSLDRRKLYRENMTTFKEVEKEGVRLSTTVVDLNREQRSFGPKFVEDRAVCRWLVYVQGEVVDKDRRDLYLLGRRWDFLETKSRGRLGLKWYALQSTSTDVGRCLPIASWESKILFHLSVEVTCSTTRGAALGVALRLADEKDREFDIGSGDLALPNGDIEAMDDHGAGVREVINLSPGSLPPDFPGGCKPSDRT